MRASAFRLLSPRGTAVFLVSLLVSSALFFLGPPLVQGADPGQTIFDQKCKACHTVGGGRTVGPDLKGVTEKRDRAWLVRTIVEPDQLVAQGDPIAKQLIQEYGMAMPKVGVSQQEAESIIAFLSNPSGAGAPAATQQTTSPAKAPAAKATGNALTGKALFTGEVRFQNGAAACAACHNVQGIGVLGGGNIAKDVTASYRTLGPDAVRSILQTAPFPVMREALTGQPLTETEIDDLMGFLRDAGTQSATGNNDGVKFLIIGILGLVPLMGAWELIWRGRLRGVRQGLIRGNGR